MTATTNFLDNIIRRKSERIQRAKRAVPLPELVEKARKVRMNAQPLALRAVLSEGKEGLSLIAEFKKASPSKGDINRQAQPAEFARIFQENGAAAISVLTEEGLFKGSLTDLTVVKEVVHVPVLRKDFIVAEYQIFETAAAGADALLLIVAALDDRQLASLRRLAEDDLQMDALVEVHTADEMRRAADCGAKLIGINNRNLRTFAVSLDTSEKCLAAAPPDAILVSESGLRSHADLLRLQEAGFHGFLIGEALMTAADPGETLRRLTGKT